MKLFRFVDYKLEISEEALLIKPFRNIWKRDRSLQKERALAELGYVYFMCDPRSDFSYIIDDEERSKEIIKLEGIKNFKIDDEIEEAIVVYTQLTNTISALALKSTKKALNKLQLFLENIDLTETLDKGGMKYPLNMVAATVKQIPGLIAEVSKAEKDLAKELQEDSRIRGTGEKKVMEDLF